MKIHIPVITIDGPSGSGKGTIGYQLAQKLQWHFLDSGSLYRCLAVACDEEGVNLDDVNTLVNLAHSINISYLAENHDQPPIILLNNSNVSTVIRDEKYSHIASTIAAIPEVRKALLERQKMFKKKPGLVADGRDMGTVVFPQADLKIYLTASQEERAKRRYNQLKQKGIDVNLAGLLADVKQRDERDMHRVVAPLVPADDAVVLDCTTMSVEDVINFIWQQIIENHLN